MIPFQVMLAPLFTLVNSFGLIDTYPGIILPYIAFGVPYQVFILHGFFRNVPKELSEAALIDGASHFTIFRRIFLPVSIAGRWRRSSSSTSSRRGTSSQWRWCCCRTRTCGRCRLA